MSIFTCRNETLEQRYEEVAMAVVEAQDLEVRAMGEKDEMEPGGDEFDWSQLGVVHREDPSSSSGSVDSTD